MEDKYEKSKAERKKHIDAILNSSSNKKIVVAGPGTGKTFLFKEILKDKKKSLTLTFVNTLVEDLSLELCGISEVKTLHGFARSELGKIESNKDGVKIFPKLSQVITEDAKILLNKDIDFDKIFHNLENKKDEIDFYKKRKDYYNKYYGYADIVYAIVKYLEGKKDKVPNYEQVVVDEFQDFNKLEVALIELLSEKSPILLAGDDDQALYAFKDASADHIREKHSDANKNYASFSLPYCSRCTRVIVEATNDIISSALKNNNLKNRISKKYEYFEDEKKDKESSLNPKIVYSQVFAKQIPWFIEQQIGKIAENEKNKFSVLIISPIKIQSRFIVKGLKNKGFSHIEYLEKKDDKLASLLDGLKILLEDKKSNLGWRVVAKALLSNVNFNTLVKETEKETPKNILDIIEKNLKKEVEEMLKILKDIKNDKDIIDRKKFEEFLSKIGFEPYETMVEILKNEIGFDIRGSNPGLRKIPIKATTIQSSKGLSSEYVFITHFDDTYFVKDKDKKKISDQDICNFLVALTRARKKVFLISSIKKEPTFLKWINANHIEKL